MNDQSNANYSVRNEIIYSTEVLKSNLCHCNDPYILVSVDIAIIRHNVTEVAFKKCAPSINCITKIDETKTDDAEDLDLVMPMYNLLEYNLNYSDTTGSLWFYSEDEASSYNADIENDDAFKSFKYRAKLLWNAVADGADGTLKNTIIFVPLKYLSYFWRSLD